MKLETRAVKIANSTSKAQRCRFQKNSQKAQNSIGQFLKVEMSAEDTRRCKLMHALVIIAWVSSNRREKHCA